MPTTIQIHVFRGDQPELLPAMCMYCARPLGEDEYQRVVMKVGDGVPRPVPLPICARERLPAGVLHPDGHGQANVNTAAMGAAFGALGAVLAHNVQRHQEGIRATFTFRDVHDLFASELDRLRKLSPAEYDQMMAKANQAFAARIAGSVDLAQEAARQRDKDEQQAADAATFGLRDAAGAGTVSKEVTRSSSSHFLIVVLVVGFLSVVLLVCVSTALIGYWVVYNRQAAEEAIARKAKLDPPREQRAKIKMINKEEGTIQFLLPNSAKQTFSYTDKTIFYDRQVKQLAGGVDALQLEEYCVILPTEDRKSLQWLKVTNPP